MLLAVVHSWDIFHWSALASIVVPICTFLSYGYAKFKKKIFIPWQERNEAQHAENLQQSKELARSINQLSGTVNQLYNDFDKRFTVANKVHDEQQEHLEKHDDQILNLQNDNYYLKKKVGIDNEEEK